MLIPDERQMFQVGDKIETTAGQRGVITSISSHSVYYEDRPIASYTRYRYAANIDGDIRSLTLDEIIVSH